VTLTRVCLLLVLWFGCAPSRALEPPIAPTGEALVVSLVTVSPGELYWERFGHNAIRIVDREAGTDTLYNYGIFDFEQPNFLLNFVRGRMQYRMAAWPTREELVHYVADGRRIVEQRLNLTPARGAALKAKLDWNALPENAGYRYDYFRDNCSTRVRDALDGALDGAIRRGLEGRSRGFTYRADALRLTAPDLWLYLGIHLGLGPATDRPLDFWDEAFVPMELSARIAELAVTDEAGRTAPLVLATEELSPQRLTDPDELPPDWRWRFGLVGVLLAGALVACSLERTRRRTATRMLGAALASVLTLALGLAGLLLAGLWGFTDHEAAWRNENLLIFNPFWLALVPATLMSMRAGHRAKPWHRTLAIALLGSCALAWFLKVFRFFPQDNLDWIALWLPIQCALVYRWTRAQ